MMFFNDSKTMMLLIRIEQSKDHTKCEQPYNDNYKHSIYE